MALKIIKYPILTQIKIWVAFWIVATLILTPLLVLLIQGMGVDRWIATPIWFKAIAISLPMIIFMPPLGEWVTRKITGQREEV
jgi:uncharacterized membrane protein YqaE (UPF0057 family)